MTAVHDELRTDDRGRPRPDAPVIPRQGAKNQMRTPTLLTALALAGTGLVAGPAVAHADGGGTTPLIQYETAFSGQVQNLQTGHTVDAQTFKRTIQLRANKTFTYHLRLPAGFNEESSASVNYALYPTSGPGYAVSSPIGSGRQPAYFGATVMGTKFNGSELAVGIRTAKLSRPMTLQLTARGTVS
jgi:hypothetical protein